MSKWTKQKKNDLKFDLGTENSDNVSNALRNHLSLLNSNITSSVSCQLPLSAMCQPCSLCVGEVCGWRARVRARMVWKEGVGGSSLYMLRDNQICNQCDECGKIVNTHSNVSRSPPIRVVDARAHRSKADDKLSSRHHKGQIRVWLKGAVCILLCVGNYNAQCRVTRGLPP